MMAENAVTQILKTLPSAAGATFLALFPIVNPFGGIPLFFSLTSGFPASERNRTAGLEVGVVRQCRTSCLRFPQGHRHPGTGPSPVLSNR